MIKSLKYSLFILLIAVFWIPMAQQYTHYFVEPKLNGAFVPPVQPECSIEKLNNFQYQKEVEDYLNFNFGFRPFFVKLKNTLEYLLFKQINVGDQIEGKNGYIYSFGSTERTFGNDYNGREKNGNTVFKIKLLKNEIENNGGKLFVVIAPSKESILPEFLPDNYQNKEAKMLDYFDFINEYKKKDIDYIDFYSIFKKYKHQTSVPLFYKTSFHWSSYAASFVQDTLCEKISNMLSLELPKIKLMGVEVLDTARDSDDDFEDPMNLLYNLNSEKYFYPKLVINQNEKSKKPNVIFLGDSFFWQLKNLRTLKSVLSEESRFWYYFSKTFPLNDLAGDFIDKTTVLNELLSADVVVLFGSMGTMDNFPYGLTEHIYTLLYNESMVNAIKDKLYSILPDIDKADKNEESLKEKIITEAHDLYRNKRQVKLKACNKMFVCADAANEKLIIADKPIASLWETFSIIEFKDGTVAILSFEDKLLSAELDSDKRMVANRENIWQWETFIIEKQGKNKIAIKAFNGKYLSLDKKNNQLYAVADAVGENELFEIIE